MLRDRLVCGVNHNAIQRRLLSAKEPLTFDLALKLAKAQESAEQNLANLQTGVQLGDKLDKQSLFVHKQTHKSDKTKSKPQPKCYRCSGPHFASSCKYKDTECHACKKKGHIASACRTKAPQKGSRQTHKQKSTHRIEASEEHDESYTMFTLNEASTDPIIVSPVINGVTVDTEYDTGASLSVIIIVLHTQEFRKQALWMLSSHQRSH